MYTNLQCNNIMVYNLIIESKKTMCNYSHPKVHFNGADIDKLVRDQNFLFRWL